VTVTPVATTVLYNGFDEAVDGVVPRVFAEPVIVKDEAAQVFGLSLSCKTDGRGCSRLDGGLPLSCNRAAALLYPRAGAVVVGFASMLRA
jgi:hypothetical protein